MKKEIANPFPFKACFLCGRENPHGLHLRFHLDDESGEVFTEYVPEERFAGQGDILHGALQMGLLDEAMGWASFAHTGIMGVTTGIDVRFLRPVYISAGAVRVGCRVLERDGRDVRLEGELVGADGTVCTTATGVYRLLSPERHAALIRG